MLLSLRDMSRELIKVVVTLTLGLATLSSWGNTTGADSIKGYWVILDGSALIEVYSTLNKTGGNEYSVRIVALRDPLFTIVDSGAPTGELRRDIYNTTPRLRQRTLEGINIASGLKYNNGTWQGGKIYDPGSGSYYRCQLKLAPGGYLRVRGYMGISLLGRTMYWQRAGDFKHRVMNMLSLLPSHEKNQ